MTDRIHSCKHSPNGKHLVRRVDSFSCRVCVYCLRSVPSYSKSSTPVPQSVGWNVPADDPDAHIGAVGGE
ncbi:MAG TPA: hypothetical protein VFA59_16885 [Vicinamibacterales bacterium]|nr:hypothetical protein [Vicinamibacterales bacterium]